jgi:hypothetical protein
MWVKRPAPALGLTRINDRWAIAEPICGGERALAHTKESEADMPVWVVKATWIEDEAEASEQWEVSAATAHDAVKEVTARLRFQPHHVDARRLTEAEAEAAAARSVGGPARRIPPQ